MLEVSDDRAVSEVLGFVLLFSVVLLSIVMVSVVGTNIVHDGRDEVVVTNVESGFQGMAVTMQDIYQDNAPDRSISLTMDRGQMNVGEPVELIVSIEDGSDWDVLARGELQPIVYELDDSKVIYSGTAIIREEREGAAVVRRPDFRLGSDRTIVPAIYTNSTGTQSIGGRTTVDFSKGTSVINQTQDDTAMNITIDTVNENRAEAWNRTLNEMRPSSSSYDCEIKSGTTKVECEYDLNADARILVHNLTVDYSLSS